MVTAIQRTLVEAKNDLVLPGLTRSPLFSPSQRRAGQEARAAPPFTTSPAAAGMALVGEGGGDV